MVYEVLRMDATPLDLRGQASNKRGYPVASVTHEAVPAVEVGMRSECDLSMSCYDACAVGSYWNHRTAVRSFPIVDA